MAKPKPSENTNSDTVAVPKWVIQWLIPSVSGLIIALVTWYFTSHVPLQISSQLTPTNERIGKLEGKFEGYDKTIEGFDKKLDLILKMSSIAKGPTAGNIQEYKNDLNDMNSLLVTAKEKGVIIEPDTIARVGHLVLERDVNMPELQPVAWDTAVRFADYCSYLQAALNPSSNKDGMNPAPSPPVKYPAGSMVRSSSSSWYNTTITLDWGDWDNTLFRNCLIKYEGGPVKLNKVKFENCQFVVGYEIKGKKLIDSILASMTPTLDLT